MQGSSRRWPSSRWCSSSWVSGGPGSSSGPGTPASSVRYSRRSPPGPALPRPPARPPRRTDRAGRRSRAPGPPLPPYEPGPVPGTPSRRLEQPRHAAGELGIVARDLDDLAPGPTSRDDAHRPPVNVERPGQGFDHRLVGPAVDGPFAHPDHDCPVMAAAHCLAGRSGPHMDCHLHGTATRSVVGTVSPVAFSQIARWGAICALPSPLRTPGSVTRFHGDHCLGLPGVLQRLSLDGVPHPVDVAFPESGTPYYERLRHASVFQDRVDVRPCPVRSDGVVIDGPAFALSAVRLDHDPETFGWRIEEPPGRHMLAERLDEAGIRGPAVGTCCDRGR